MVCVGCRSEQDPLEFEDLYDHIGPEEEEEEEIYSTFVDKRRLSQWVGNNVCR